MNDESQNPEAETVEMPGAASAEPAVETSESTSDAATTAAGIAGDLRELGLQFAAALKAAASTPEARELRGEIREGLTQMRDEIDGTLENLRAGAKRKVEERRAAGGSEAEMVSEVAEAVEGAVEDAAPTSSREQRAAKLAGQVRAELAQAVRNLSAALDKMAGTVEPGAAEPEIVVEAAVDAEVVEETSETV